MIVAHIDANWQQRYEELALRYERVSRQLEEVVGEHDLWSRVKRNEKMSYAYRFMYMSLVELYPALLDGVSVEIRPKEVRRNAGAVSERSATYFFRDFQSLGIFSYDAGRYDEMEHDRLGRITPNPEKFPYPEDFDTRSAEDRKKDRAREKQKRDAAKEALKRYECEVCHSPQIEYTPVCTSCGHIHIGEGIPTIQISIVEAPNSDNWDEVIEQYCQEGENAA